MYEGNAQSGERLACASTRRGPPAAALPVEPETYLLGAAERSEASTSSSVAASGAT